MYTNKMKMAEDTELYKRVKCHMMRINIETQGFTEPPAAKCSGHGDLCNEARCKARAALRQLWLSHNRHTVGEDQPLPVAGQLVCYPTTHRLREDMMSPLQIGPNRTEVSDPLREPPSKLCTWKDNRWNDYVEQRVCCTCEDSQTATARVQSQNTPPCLSLTQQGRAQRSTL